VSGVTRIPSRAGFLRARNYGLKAVSRGLVMQAAPNQLAEWRVGFTASRKIGNAVIRNRARRRLRAAMRESLQPLARYGLDYVMIARYDTAKREWQNLVEDVEKAVGYLHRQMDRQDVGYRSSGLSRKGGHI
jgi:ribonuclease P protein component